MDKTFNKVIKSHLVLAVLSVFAVVLMAGGVTYALYQVDKKNTTNQKIEIGTLDADLTSISGAIVVSDLYPEKSSAIDDSKTKYQFTVSNTGTYDLSYEIYLKDATDTLLSSSTEYAGYTRIASSHYQFINYKLDGNTVAKLTKNQSGDKFVILKGSIKAGESEEHYLQFFLDDQETTTTGAPNEIAGSILSLDIYMDASVYKKTAVEKIIASSQGTRSDFDVAATTDEGIFEMQDDYGTSYYYRGAVENNYVKYGVNKDGQEMWWRIIRINGDGSVKMIYDGTQGYTNGTVDEARYIKTSQPFNATYNDAKYVGWMYGPAGTTASTSKAEAQSNVADSDIKKIVDAWYKENIVDTGYGANVSDEIFCNDRSTPGSTATGWSGDTGLGYGTNATAYGAIARLYKGFSSSATLSPSFTCPEKVDAYTVNDTTKGNGALTYPVGLITADEIVAAGSGKYGTRNSKYYLYKTNGYYLWSLSPSYYINGVARVLSVYTSGQLNDLNVNNTSGAVAPVINLSTGYVSTLKGTGTISDPYRA